MLCGKNCLCEWKINETMWGGVWVIFRNFTTKNGNNINRKLTNLYVGHIFSCSWNMLLQTQSKDTHRKKVQWKFYWFSAPTHKEFSIFIETQKENFDSFVIFIGESFYQLRNLEILALWLYGWHFILLLFDVLFDIIFRLIHIFLFLGSESIFNKIAYRHRLSHEFP